MKTGSEVKLLSVCHTDPKYRAGILTFFSLTPLPFHNTCSQVCNHELNTIPPYYLQTALLNSNNLIMWEVFLKEKCIKIKAESTYFDTFQMHQ